MKHDIPSDTRSLGADLRALRKSRSLTLTELAAQLDKSTGWLSQVERGISEPSISDLRQIARLLDVSISSLFRANSQTGEEGHIVRAKHRRPIGSREAGLVEELLSPDLTDDFELVHSTFAPGAQMPQNLTRPTQEVGYILTGQLDLWINDQHFALKTGDSFRIRNEPYRWANPHSDPCIAIWAIAPPVY